MINEKAKDGTKAALDLAYTYILIGDQLVNVGHITQCFKEDAGFTHPFDVAPVKRWDASKVDCGPDGACG